MEWVWVWGEEWVWDKKESNTISSFNPDLVDCELHIFDPPLEKSSGHEERLHDTP